MKTLPKYFIIKRDETNPLWQTYINWLNKTYDYTYVWKTWDYYWFDWNPNRFDNKSSFRNNPTLITLEQWNEAVNLFVEWEEVEVSMTWITWVEKTVFLAKIKNRFLCVSSGDEFHYKNWSAFGTTCWKNARKPQKQEEEIKPKYKMWDTVKEKHIQWWWIYFMIIKIWRANGDFLFNWTLEKDIVELTQEEKEIYTNLTK